MVGHKVLTLASLLGVSAALASSAWADCSPTSWQDCAGKPWVTGKLDTPIGEVWWPNRLWGGDDEAGSTNWFTKPDVFKRGKADAALAASMFHFGEIAVGDLKRQLANQGIEVRLED